MRKSKEEVLPFVEDRKGGAEHFGVSERTFTRWLEFHGLYQPKENFGGYKLSAQQIHEIRQGFKEGTKMKDLAQRYGVTFATISRIVHNITHKVIVETAKVSVIYNVK